MMETAVAPERTAKAVRRVAIITLGCKLNQADSDAIARQFAGTGIEVIDRPALADAYVINTCSVTHVADRKARHMVRMARRLAPDAPIVLTGCYVETAGPDIARDLDVDLALGNRDKSAIAAHVAGIELPDPVSANGQPAGLRTRSFVKVQEGCNDVCAFCIVPRTRGREVSQPVDSVVGEVLAREAEGVQEVVLTGTQLGAYGRDVDLRPAAVISAVLARTSVPRIRFSSLQPQDITPELLALWDDPRLCRHFHLALQSGSESTLGRMRRRYTSVAYRDAAQRIRAQAGDEVAITTDVIVGFPGETDDEFGESLAFVEEMQFARLHVFPYSRRTGTTADKMPDHVPSAVKHERMQQMLAVARSSQQSFMSRFVGRTMPVLWERSRTGDDGVPVWDGLTDNYIRVSAKSERLLENRLCAARMIAIDGEEMEGEPL